MQTDSRNVRNEKSTRKRYFINRSFQLKHILSIVLIQIFTVILTSIVCLYLVYFVIDSNKVGISHNYSFLLQWGILLITALVAGIYIAIRYTHNIAGPIFQTCKQLKAASEGDIPEGDINFRKNDCFKELESNLNKCMETMRSYKESYDIQSSSNEEG